MKKGLFILLAVIIAGSFVLVGCGEKTTAPAAKVEAAPAAPMSDPVEDASLAYFSDYAQGGYIIKEDVFLDKVNAGEDMFILDIRQPDVYVAGHVKGAVNVPWGPGLAKGLESVPQTGQVYVYCYTGQTAGQAVAVMNVLGIPAKSVRYGFVRGISTVEGYETVISTEPADAVETYSIDPKLAAASTEYFSNLGEAPFKNNIIAAADAAAILAAGETGVRFVDIRTAEDFAKGHIEGAMNLPFGAGMQSMFTDLPADKKLIVTCYSGQTAGQVVGILNLLGYDAASINSGMGTGKTGDRGWANEGFETVM